MALVKMKKTIPLLSVFWLPADFLLPAVRRFLWLDRGVFAIGGTERPFQDVARVRPRGLVEDNSRQHISRACEADAKRAAVPYVTPSVSFPCTQLLSLVLCSAHIIYQCCSSTCTLDGLPACVPLECGVPYVTQNATPPRQPTLKRSVSREEGG